MGGLVGAKDGAALKRNGQAFGLREGRWPAQTGSLCYSEEAACAVAMMAWEGRAWKATQPSDGD